MVGGSVGLYPNETLSNSSTLPAIARSSRPGAPGMSALAVRGSSGYCDTSSTRLATTFISCTAARKLRMLLTGTRKLDMSTWNASRSPSVIWFDMT